jgi:hypothetical protein
VQEILGMMPARFAVKKTRAVVAYWIGVILTAACILLVLIGQSEVVHSLEHTEFPLSWAFAILAVLAFTVGEILQHGQKRVLKNTRR